MLTKLYQKKKITEPASEEKIVSRPSKRKIVSPRPTTSPLLEQLQREYSEKEKERERARRRTELEALQSSITGRVAARTRFLEARQELLKTVFLETDPATFVPYEVRLSRISAHNTEPESTIRRIAIVRSIPYRWPGRERDLVYLVRNRDDQLALRILDKKDVDGDIDRYILHDAKGSLMFANRRYPYSISDSDLKDLARRMDVVEEELVARLIKLGLEKDRVIKIELREEELSLLYQPSSFPSDKEAKVIRADRNKRFTSRSAGRGETLVKKVSRSSSIDGDYFEGLPFFEKLNDEEVTTKDLAELERLRPQARIDCYHVPRPCPYFTCPYNMGMCLTTEGTRGELTIYYPGWNFLEVEHSCMLDAVETGGMTLEECGLIFNLTRERVRQIEEKALPRLKKELSIQAGINRDLVNSYFQDRKDDVRSD